MGSTVNAVPVHRVRKRPIEYWAVQWDGTRDQAEAIAKRFGNAAVVPIAGPKAWVFAVYTLEGVVYPSEDSWIIQGVENECWPVKKSVFEASYDVLPIEEYPTR